MKVFKKNKLSNKFSINAYEVGFHVCPSCHRVEFDRFGFRRIFALGHAFEFTHVLDQLVIIGVSPVIAVGVPPFVVRFDVPAVFPIELVDERERVALPSRIPFPGDVFVPSGDEHQFRVELKRAVPLLLEIPSVQIAVHARVESFQYAEIPSVSVFHVEGSAVSFAVGYLSLPLVARVSVQYVW